VWAELVGHLEFDAALDAVRAHYRAQSRPIYPADVLSIYQTPVPVLSASDLIVAGDLAKVGIGFEEYLERRGEPGWVDSMRARAVTRA
jgi:hypothetical protein